MIWCRKRRRHDHQMHRLSTSWSSYQLSDERCNVILKPMNFTSYFWRSIRNKRNRMNQFTAVAIEYANNRSSNWSSRTVNLTCLPLSFSLFLSRPFFHSCTLANWTHNTLMIIYVTLHHSSSPSSGKMGLWKMYPITKLIYLLVILTVTWRWNETVASSRCFSFFFFSLPSYISHLFLIFFPSFIALTASQQILSLSLNLIKIVTHSLSLTQSFMTHKCICQWTNWKKIETKQ